MLQKLQNSRNALGLLFMLPAAVLLILFLTYPLILGVWLGFTDTKIGREGIWIGLQNYEFLLFDSVTQLALFNSDCRDRRCSASFTRCWLSKFLN